MSIVDLHEVKRHLHYADDSNDVSLKTTLQIILDRNTHLPLNKLLYY